MGCFARRRCRLRTILCLKRGAMIALAATIAFGRGGGRRTPPPSLAPRVVVTLDAPSLAEASSRRAASSPVVKARRLDLESPRARLPVRARRPAERSRAAHRARDPSAASAGVTASSSTGSPSVLPTTTSRARPHRRRRVPSTRTTEYHLALDSSPELIGADQLWGAELHDGGQRHQDRDHRQGIDQMHPFFDPAGYVYPPGYPKGKTHYTTPKVIVARAFPPARRPGSTRARPSTLSTPTT